MLELLSNVVERSSNLKLGVRRRKIQNRTRKVTKGLKLWHRALSSWSRLRIQNGSLFKLVGLRKSQQRECLAAGFARRPSHSRVGTVYNAKVRHRDSYLNK